MSTVSGSCGIHQESISPGCPAIDPSRLVDRIIGGGPRVPLTTADVHSMAAIVVGPGSRARPFPTEAAGGRGLRVRGRLRNDPSTIDTN